MPVLTDTYLPGIRFEAKTEPPRETLPRMDIAAFVGFASSGPLDLPVAVESVTRFREIFGPDLSLAWDPKTGRRGRAYLGPAVETFFRNGGRRCWIVRVADSPETNRFVLPGLMNPQSGKPVVARARCPGSWSDILKADTALRETLVGPGLYQSPGIAGPSIVFPGGDPGITPGDLLEVEFSVNLVMYGIAGEVSTANQTAPSSIPLAPVNSGETETEVKLTRQFWFRTAPETTGLGAPVAVTLLQGDQTIPLSGYSFEITNGQYEIHSSDENLTRPAPGDFLQVEFPGNVEIWLAVEEVTRTAGTGSPPGGDVLITASKGLWPLTSIEAVAALGSSADCSVTRLEFDLLVWKDQEINARLIRLGFCQGHPRFWGNIPMDSELFADSNKQSTLKGGASLFAEVTDPRFPLAGPAIPEDVYIPLGMRLQPDSATANPPVCLGSIANDPRERLRRDGVLRFQPEIFLDKRLQTHTTRTLDNAMKSLRYEQEESLEGIYSLYGIDEITLVAVPDSLHLGWDLALPVEPEILLPPEITGIERVKPFESILRWSQESLPESDLEFEVQEDVVPDFQHPEVIYQGTTSEVNLAFPDDCDRWYYYRIRAIHGDMKSAWSGTRAFRVPYTGFVECAGRLWPPELLLSYNNSPPVPVLSWSEVPGAGSYILEQAGDPEFVTTKTIATLKDTGDPEYTFHPESGDREISYYRVKALPEEDGSRESPWSNTEYFPNLATGQLENISPKRYAKNEQGNKEELLNLQRSLLRFAAVTGHMFAVLGFPHHYQVEKIREHLASLYPSYNTNIPDSPSGTSGFISPLSKDEEPVLSYGALYHPWVGLRLEGGDPPVSFIPPDGLMTGSIAGQALTRGAWQAPANRPLLGVVALDPPFEKADWRQVYIRQVNLIRPDPRGMLALSAKTLSADPDLVPIGARRLMILLRRLVLREGNTYVFESNDTLLRRRIDGKFRSLLTELFQRGAFAGTTPAESFRVITDASVNTRETIDRGQLIVELRVAPAKPLSFLRILLFQKDFEGLTVQEGS